MNNMIKNLWIVYLDKDYKVAVVSENKYEAEEIAESWYTENVFEPGSVSAMQIEDYNKLKHLDLNKILTEDNWDE